MTTISTKTRYGAVQIIDSFGARFVATYGETSFGVTACDNLRYEVFAKVGFEDGVVHHNNDIHADFPVGKNLQRRQTKRHRVTRHKSGMFVDDAVLCRQYSINDILSVLACMVPIVEFVSVSLRARPVVGDMHNPGR